MESRKQSASSRDSQLSIGERQRRLIEASDRYVRGELSAADFREAERRYMTNYGAVTLELARRAIGSTIRRGDRAP